MARIMVAMSGGVDSSVAALLLTREGHTLAGVTMCLGVVGSDGDRPQCCGPDAVRDARTVCDRLDIPHYVFDYSQDLQRDVIDEFRAEYLAGRTPNPCVLCNQRLKFGSLLAKARAAGYDALATGHYARVSQTGLSYLLQRPADRTKDQTYFLYAMPRESLAATSFPLENLLKHEVRELAMQARLPVAAKPESQDICFAPGGDYRALLPGVPGETPGEFVTPEGSSLGHHRGIAHYTVGQRKGLGISAASPLYVIAIDPLTNRITLGPRERLFSPGLVATRFNLLVDSLPERALVMIRYNHPPVPARVSRDGERVLVRFDEPQAAVAPGQSAVLYDGDTVLGGGIIQAALAA